MLDEIINDCVEIIYEDRIPYNFFIGFEPIKEFCKFFIIAKNLQDERLNESQTILKYVKKAIEENKEDFESDIPESELALEREEYDSTLYRYNTLNAEKMLDFEKRKKMEKEYRESLKQSNQDAPTMGNPNRFEGNRLYDFQLNEFKTLTEIKKGVFDVNANVNLTYNRILGKKGYMKKIQFAEFAHFVNILEIEIDDDYLNPFKNIRYYKLEKRLNFELIKSMCNAINICRRKKESVDRAVAELFPLFQLPLVQARQEYADKYAELDLKGREAWKFEVALLFKFINAAVNLSLEAIKTEDEENIITDDDLESFKSIYGLDTFENTYEFGIDYNKKDFKLLMSKMDEMNANAWNNLEC